MTEISDQMVFATMLFLLVIFGSIAIEIIRQERQGLARTCIFDTFEEFHARPDKSINGVSPDHAAEHPHYQEDNATNRGCWNCHDCVNCIDCADCLSCSDCTSCSHCLGGEGKS